MRHVLREGEDTYILESSAMTGKVTLLVNGRIAMKIGKKVYQITNENNETLVYKLVGTELNGLTLVTPNGNIVVTRKLSVLEMIIVWLPLVTTIAGVVLGGAIGGFFGVLFGMLGLVLNAKVIRSQLNIVVKVLICLVVSAVAAALVTLMYVIVAGTFLELLGKL